VILITRLNGTKIYLNAELVKSVESTPDAVITLTTGDKIVAHEPVEVIIARIIEYQRQVHAGPSLNQAGE
jgi:flagellar protein FlbD